MVAANSLLLFLLTTGLTPDLDQPTTPIPWRSISETDEPPVNEDNEFDSKDLLPCPKHERFDRCLAHCQRNCTNYKEKYIPCPLICEPGCICVEGYVRGPEGKCIPKEKCSRSSERCREHSKFDHCGAHPSCQKNCQNYNENFPCPAICVPGCICEDGYVEGPNKECIKKEECRHYSEERCPKHSKFDHCGAHPLCQKNCQNYNENFPCPAICMPGCICEDGYVEGPNKECIKKEECRHYSEGWDSIFETEEPPVNEDNEFESDALKCPEHEHWVLCEAHCQKNCTNYKQNLPCNKRCVGGCVCDRGYVRGLNGKCILEEKCPMETEKCPEHEHWDRCLAHCQRNCSNYDKHIPCTMACFPGCVCDEGHVRGPNGKCILKEKCPKEPDTNCPKTQNMMSAELTHRVKKLAKIMTK
ncbi:zonadhesin [Trichonephila clavata]|uniref:Zonadhesin n=1 Tax=Trichonephila clavata TaxID=2740835 RepID=A0A8X6EY99_TRICU|nr:zonadhesin [Trichonephila clavata]